MNFNKAIIVGNLTRDPETKTLPSGQSVTSFSLATNRVWNNQDGEKQEAIEFHNIVSFGKLADICSRYLNKGRLVLVEGRIQTRSWQDQSGIKKYWTEIVAESMQMGPRNDGGNTSPSSRPSQPDSKPDISNLPSQEEIPVIEADEPIVPIPASTQRGEQDRDPDQSVGKDKQGINIDNIPF